MADPQKREIAHKIKIGDLLRSSFIFEESDNPNKRLRFVQLGDKNILRVNIIANIIDKFESDGEKKFASLTIDDGSGQLRARVFSDDIDKISGFSQGDTIVMIGLLRHYNDELYIIPEIIKRLEPKYLLIRKLEIEKGLKEHPSKEVKKETLALRDEILKLIKENEANEGIDKDQIIMKVSSAPDLINPEITRLLEEGLIYEPRPGRVRYLG